MKQSKQLYSQNKIAEILGISRGTFSKWLKENSVSPKQQKGQRKLYDETVIEQYKQSKKTSGSKDSKRLTTVELLQDNLKEKQQEIDYLKEQLEEKDAQIKVKDETISEFGLKFAKLADQAQQLNLVDKSQLIKSKQETASNEKTVEKTPKNSKKEKRFWQFWK
ncbi:helix-turn-helix domain-containing protein (plasmid) [Lactobacillus kefiranofaciens subsp. kefirgranum]|uniref:helix-turn-helix domain-containing protein n=1 Tax=Lactobacillus kefiranofaciens TaxID=267818 RepID=UPI001FBAE0FF|nr:helix-turn-helix domain-containing protein [Lactobacillus kefiranofaciens]MCJ2173085.1 helix-turn-helix domain-containing protein [Lactobacillus kefiranofaciens]URW72419.1 helix-turn-helix domain-containing protein [Lactobacillus kefiranofaciens subsp. kefirgranum]URW74364.1 helix-turn-helix domain-containing protein [Lactobacillus kefiranofaciens subsp. kefirgranum]